MSKKLEKSELEYIKDSFDSKTKNYIAIGQKYEQREISKAEMNSLVQENLETQKDLNKYMQKLEGKYGKVNIDLNDGSIQEIENNEQSNK
jgi:isopropylmalate/homocitrate/citramalate synthase